MIVSKDISLVRLMQWSGRRIIIILLVTGLIAALYHFKVISFAIPWLPLSVIGTAVAFYLGFKNNQAYDRMWEARKIWGGIVNNSRSWGMQVDGFITSFFGADIEEQELKNTKKRLIHRHIAWLYAHRSQLLIPEPWEHISQNGYAKKIAEKFQQNFGVGLISDEITELELLNLLSKK